MPSWDCVTAVQDGAKQTIESLRARVAELEVLRKEGGAAFSAAMAEQEQAYAALARNANKRDRANEARIAELEAAIAALVLNADPNGDDRCR